MFSQLSCHSQTATFLPGNKELEPKKHCVFGVNVHFLTLPLCHSPPHSLVLPFSSPSVAAQPPHACIFTSLGFQQRREVLTVG